MIKFEEYTKDTYKHVPESYNEHMDAIYQICDLNDNKPASCTMDGWKLGFERAYRAAKAGKLDFQQK